MSSVLEFITGEPGGELAAESEFIRSDFDVFVLFFVTSVIMDVNLFVIDVDDFGQTVLALLVYYVGDVHVGPIRQGLRKVDFPFLFF